LGIGVVGPVYFALHYISARIANFKALDHRLTNLAYTRTVLPVLVVAFYIPHYLCYFSADLATRHSAAWIWQLSPAWISGLQILLSKTVSPDTIETDKVDAPTRDLPTIRYTVGACVVLASTVWLSVLARSPFSLATIFLPPLGAQTTGWISTARVILQVDHVVCWTSALLWLSYLFADMKYAGMVTQSWATIFAGVALSSLALGPGATFGLGWLWREDILVTKKHKGAVVRGRITSPGVANDGKKRV
jgi:hypothetical protein